MYVVNNFYRLISHYHISYNKLFNIIIGGWKTHKARVPQQQWLIVLQLQKLFSLILMAICDSNYCFRIIDVGSYGKESECNVFKSSTFGKKLYSGSLHFPPDQCLPGDDNGVPQPFILVADEAFALNKNLLRPFPGRTLNNNRRIIMYIMFL